MKLKNILKLSVIFLLLGLFTLLFVQKPISRDHAEERDYSRWTKLQNFTPISPQPLDASYYTYTSLHDFIYTPGNDATDLEIELLRGTQNEKIIRIDTAYELYLFSRNVRFHNTDLASDVIDVLLDLHYVLGNDIDYSVMLSQQFVPIGYNFTFEGPSAIDTSKSFTGIFDGRGFEILNLYMAGYDELKTEETIDEEVIDVALTSYYSMFNYNEGEIRNLGLVNPTFELLDINLDLTKTSNLVGENSGTIDHVYVIDNRPNEAQAGIRMRAPIGTTTASYQASGVVFTNESAGEISNVYYVSPTVINASYASAFEVQPVLFENNNLNGISNLVYDGANDGGNTGVYKLTLNVGGVTFNVTTPNTYAINVETIDLKNNTPIGVEQIEPLDEQWYLYPDDRYPTLLGLEYDSGNGAYLIKNSIDLVTFSKLITYNTVLNDTPFRDATYHITEDIDMSQVAEEAYVTPNIEFTGQIKGTKSIGQHAILHFSPKYTVDTENYYIGLFSVLSGTVEDITFISAKIELKNTDTYFGRTFLIGTVAGELQGGTISNVHVLLDMNFGSQTVGSLYAGAIAGRASGLIDTVYAQGNIGTDTANTFNSNLDVIAQYHIGGLVGASGSTTLAFYDALNTATIDTISSTDNISHIGQANIYVGGVIGKVTNTSSIKHNIGLLTNEGAITTNALLSASTVTQYAGGVIGLSGGNNYTLNYDFGVFTNEGAFDFNPRGANIIYSGGVLVANHLEQTEFIHLYNTETATISTTNFTGLNYTTLVYNVGVGGTILSQAENNANITLPTNTSFSGIYHSTQNATSLLRFVKNTGNITYQNLTFQTEVVVTGITQSLNIDYLNVYFEGTVSLLGITSNSQIWVSGITKILSINRYMENAINLGEIYTASINSSSNIYIGGLVNINLAGNLDPNGTDDYPLATLGIINSINYGNVLSTYDESYNRIIGLGNVYAGGIATFNNGSIQNVANIGNIKIDQNNVFNSNQTYFFSGGSTSTTAGKINQFRSGAVIGGVSAAVLSANSRIYDSANNGEIIAKSRSFARAGGILASALVDELTAGNITQSTLGIGLTPSDSRTSILSNSINYGNISSITENILLYGTSSTTGYLRYYTSSSSNSDLYQRVGNSNVGPGISTTSGTEDRIGIHSSAGGVIGYGLSTMRRMINHGEISSTDVAGGIVGATFVGATYTVQINTAINYGTIRVFDYTEYDSITFDLSYTSISNHFLPVNHSFIFPQNSYNMRFFPQTKRGIGGIFGRLQRGYGYTMSSQNKSFNFIVNLDPNVDLIGRLDQLANVGLSARYFDFQDADYFSAKVNDTTQAVFSGYEFFYNGSGSVSATNETVTEVVMERYEYAQVGGNWYRYTQKLIETRTQRRYNGTKYTVVGTNTSNQTSQTQVFEKNVISQNWQRISGSGLLMQNDPLVNYSTPWYVTPYDTVISNVSTSNLNSGRRYLVDAKAIPYISETENDRFFFYDSNFVMRTDSDLQEFIFYVENEVLSDTFRDDRPNGMYVLATSSGSSVGSVIPSNLSLTNLYPLDGEQPYDYDYGGSTNRTPFENEDVTTKYFELLQTRYNDKAEILQDEQDFRLEEVGGFGNKLLSPQYDYINKTITFNLHLDKVATSVTPLQFKVTDALLPTDALIAARISDYFGVDPIDYNAFRSVLENDAGMHISINAPPLLEINLNPYLGISTAQKVSLGHFVSYSEASIFIDGFMVDPYIAEYEVLLNLIPKQSVQNNPYPYLYYIDGSGSGSSFSFTSNESTIAAPFTNSIRITFRDQGGVLPTGTDISEYVSLEYDSETVDKAHYTITSELAAGGTFNQFGFVLTLNNQMRGGEYIVRFKYFGLDQEKTISITKSLSTNATLTNLAYNSSDPFVIPGGTTFTTYINFGYEIDTNSVYFTPNVDTNPSFPSYFNNTTYEVSYLTDFAISPFAELIAVTYEGMDYVSGYRRYRFDYTIEAENNSPVTYIHYIVERSMSVVEVFRNNNKINVNNIFATREAIQTNFAIDFNVHQSVAQQVYNTFAENSAAYFAVTVTAETLDTVPVPYDPSEIVGITYSTDRYFNIIMNNQTKAGTYYFTFTYKRDEQTITFGPSHTLKITKQRGVDAYLTNIQFSESAQETEYPLIYVSDSTGVIDESVLLQPRVYFGGIDYSGNKGIEFDFRVDGKVSSTPLNEYFPFFLDFLPAGAKISRKVYPIEGPEGWTTEVTADSPLNEIGELATDFTLMPATGNEPNEELEEEVIITYRVRSEDNSQTVYYHITVTDVDFNVSLIFDFVYEVSPGNRLAIKDSVLANLPILINVKNVITNVPTTSLIRPTVNDFPENFTEITNIENSIYMFYQGSNSSYRYRFGRNKSGYYIFDVRLPQAPVGNAYGYYIEYASTSGPDPLKNISIIHTNFSSLMGKYFYINGSTRNRTRYFTVVITPYTPIQSTSWGLDDYYETWR